MQDAPQPERLLLRCELISGDEHVITHTLEVSPTGFTAVCAAAIVVGMEIRATLSFPGLLEPLEVGCRVVAFHAPDGHGAPPAISCEVTRASEETRSRLAAFASKPAKATSVRPRGATYRCLVVEDSSFIRDLFSYGANKYATTRQRAFAMVFAENAEAAWQRLEGEAFDMAIVDHYLPSQSGSELIARIRSDPRLSRMSVVAISVGGTKVRDATIAAGADLFLDKPIVLRALFDTLDRFALGGAP